MKSLRMNTTKYIFYFSDGTKITITAITVEEAMTKVKSMSINMDSLVGAVRI